MRPRRRAQDDDEGERLEPGGDRDGQGDARQAERPDEDDRQGRVDRDRDDRGEDRGERVLAGVERAGQDGDQRVGGEPDQEREQGRRGQRRGPPGLAAVAEQERHGLVRRIGGERRRSGPSRRRGAAAPASRRSTNSASRPTATSRDSDGRSTTPSGTPMTPIGIWSSVNATLKPVTAPTPSVVASEVTTTNVIWVAPRPTARGAISDERLARLRVAGVDPRRVAEARGGRIGRSWTSRWPSDPATTPMARPVDAEDGAEEQRRRR